MKKITLMIVGLMMLAGNMFASEAVTVASPDITIWVKLTIKFHRPKFNCESGFGICASLSYGLDNPVSATGSDMCPIRARLTEKNQLIVEVTDAALSSYENGSTKPYFSGKTSIRLEDLYTLTPDACRSLGAKGPLTIKPGIYPVSYANGAYTVTFQL